MFGASAGVQSLTASLQPSLFQKTEVCGPIEGCISGFQAPGTIALLG
jgi:hypothetical protein